MEVLEDLIVPISVVVWICMAVLCARIAQKNGKDPIIWGVIGCLTSILGLLALGIHLDADRKQKHIHRAEPRDKPRVSSGARRQDPALPTQTKE